MNYKSIFRDAAVVAGLLLSTAGAIAAGPASNALGDTSMRRDVLSGTTDDSQTPATGDIAELQQMIRDGKVRELRTTYNGSYGASLLYYPDEMLYYVAMFQQKKFWRVIKTQNDARAETVYADFAKSTMQLSDTEIRRIKLEAEKSYADRLIATQQNRASRLQADLEVARAQQSQVADRQQQQQEAIRALRNEQAAAQAQLRALQARVQDLQKQQEGDLPTPSR
ncbi:DUF2968 domain-containing protein [Caballeronia humi]|uniref:Signal peptide protein n=1 Tax=Caballeronia humi TaxID=326474 RepID=A0A158H6E5_9BURK|nr:DUF2968 domain-containing protein [Caballeronia humi]SAL39549.1 signal peptide protein [Caballeronia humi]